MGKSVLGLDVGGVIRDWVRYKGTELASDGPRHLETPAVEEAIDSIAILNKESLFAGNIYLISRSKLGPEHNMSWLTAHGFWEKTGIEQSHFNDCNERYKKLMLCKGIGVTHFVDDRAEVLANLVGEVPHLFLFQGRKDEKEQFKEFLPSFTEVNSWKELLPLLLAV